MKTKHNHQLRFTSLAFCVLTTLFIIGCKKNNDKTGAELNTATLIGSSSWKISSVMVDNVDKTTMYTGMTLTFATDSYTTSNGKVVWPASGKWSFETSEGKVIRRDDGLEITVSSIASDKLTLELDWASTTYGGRLSAMQGHHVFKFTR